jgi:hypothetical protein
MREAQLEQEYRTEGLDPMTAHLKASIRFKPSLQQSDESRSHVGFLSRSQKSNTEVGYAYQHTVVVDPSWNPPSTTHELSRPRIEELGQETEAQIQARLVANGMDALTAHFKASLLADPRLKDPTRAQAKDVVSHQPPTKRRRRERPSPPPRLNRLQKVEQRLIEGGLQPIAAHVKALSLVKIKPKARTNLGGKNMQKVGNSKKLQAGRIRRNPAAVSHLPRMRGPAVLQQPRGVGTQKNKKGTTPLQQKRPAVAAKPRKQTQDTPQPQQAPGYPKRATLTTIVHILNLEVYLHQRRMSAALAVLTVALVGLILVARRLNGGDSVEELDAHRMSWRRADHMRRNMENEWQEPVVDDKTGRRKRRGPCPNAPPPYDISETELTPLTSQ